MLSQGFGLPAYKGVPLNFRPWDRQLRQPILIAQPKSLVTVAPERGLPAPAHASGHPRDRSTGGHMQALDETGRAPGDAPGRSLLAATAGGGGAGARRNREPAEGYTVYVTNEKDDTARWSISQGAQVTKTVKVGRRPRAITLSPDGRGSTSAPATTTVSRSSIPPA